MCQIKKSLGFFMYIGSTIVIFAIIVTLIILSRKEILDTIWAYIIAPVLFIGWLFVSAKIPKRQQAALPIMQSQAVLIEKTQNNTRSGSTYYLTFELDDGIKNIFKVNLEVYAAFSKEEKGLLKYKQIGKSDHYLNNIFVDFEE